MTPEEVKALEAEMHASGIVKDCDHAACHSPLGSGFCLRHYLALAIHQAEVNKQNELAWRGALYARDAGLFPVGYALPGGPDCDGGLPFIYLERDKWKVNLMSIGHLWWPSPALAADAARRALGKGAPK